MAQVKECGGCALCCKLLSVEELSKPACRWCSEVKRDDLGRSCGIYAQRPEACRIFACLWLLDAKMQPELRPDRCHVVFAMDEYLDGPFAADTPRLYAIVDPLWPQAWRCGLPQLTIETMLRRGGEVIVIVGERWRYCHDGIHEDGIGDFLLGTRLGMFRKGELPPGLPPTFNPDELESLK